MPVFLILSYLFMTKPHWKLSDIAWDQFDPSKVDEGVLSALKSAALVEHNSPDYVSYLSAIFSDHPDIVKAIKVWGDEERQHGEALSAWIKKADPDFDFARALEAFKSLYQVDMNDGVSRRGSPAGEMLSRCVVESATSFFYTAIKDQTEEPCLKQICQLIARDEFAHYQMFLSIMNELGGRPNALSLMKIAIQRIHELGDEELASAFYASHFYGHKIPESEIPDFDVKVFSSVYESRSVAVYQKDHAYRMSSMIARALGMKPFGRIMKTLQPVIWWYWSRHVNKMMGRAERFGYGLSSG